LKDGDAQNYYRQNDIDDPEPSARPVQTQNGFPERGDRPSQLKIVHI
jgi:hypothetical protein